MASAAALEQMFFVCAAAAVRAREVIHDVSGLLLVTVSRRTERVLGAPSKQEAWLCLSTFSIATIQ